MMADSDLVAEFNKNASNFFSSTNQQRAEIYRSYEYRDGHQWDAEVLRERQRLNKAVTTVNISAPLIRAVSGTECMKDNLLDYVPMDEQFNAETDIMADGVEYAQYASGYKSEQSIAREDAATCGIGGTVTYLDMSKKSAIAGTPLVERIFPGFIGFDNSCRGALINEKARWMFYADPVSAATMDAYLEEKIGPKTPVMGAGDYKPFLMSFSRQDNSFDVEFIYHYFWREYEDIYDVMNPFVSERGSRIGALLMQDNDVANLIGGTADAINIDWAASYWSLDREGYKKLTDTIETIGLLTGEKMPAMEYSKRKGKCYYRAEFARGMLLSRSRSYTQGGHALNLITGYFDEVMGIYYGMMRPISEVQDNLNVSISDFLGYAKTAAHGGNAYIKGAGEAIERIKKEKAHEDALTPIPVNSEIIPKALPATPQVLIEFIRLMMEIMPRALGLGQEFLGVITSGDMTDSLYGKVMKQSYAVLANFANNSASYSKRQGEIFVDIVRLMAEANDGMILPILSPGKQGAQYIRLRKQNLAREYAVRIIEKPLSADERQNTFNVLSQLAPQFQQAGINIMPVLAKYANLDMEDRERLVKLSTPQPPQPDPLNQALLKSQADLQGAQASKLQAEAHETMATMAKTIEKLQTEIEKNSAQTLQILGTARPDPSPLLAMEELRMKERIEMAKIAASAANRDLSGAVHA